MQNSLQFATPDLERHGIQYWVTLVWMYTHDINHDILVSWEIISKWPTDTHSVASPRGARPVYLRDTIMVLAVLADNLTTNDDGPAAGAFLNTRLDIY